MPRRGSNGSATLLALLLLGVAIVGALGFLNGREIVQRHWTEVGRSAPHAVARMVPMIGSPDASGLIVAWRVTLSPEYPAVVEYPAVGMVPKSGGVLTSGLSRNKVGWLLWTSLPSTLVALAVLALMVATVWIARRRGIYSRASLRLLRAVGLVALVAGPGAALLEYLARHWTARVDYSPVVSRWQLTVVWVLIGGAFLAVREVLVRASALRAELDEVI
jgi:hypothetical protein